MRNYVSMLSIPMGLFLLAAPISAETNAALTCTSSGSAKTRCFLAEPIELGIADEDIELSWTVSYSFPCRGHATALAFDTGSETVGLQYTNTSFPKREFTRDGRGPLTFVDLDPTTTARATLLGTCALTIHSVKFTPSVDEIGDWHEAAKSQAKIIGLSQTLAELAEGYANYRNWDSQQTNTVLNAAKLKVTLFENQCQEGDQTACRSAAHFRLVVGALEGKLRGTPAAPITDEAGREMATVYAEDLATEVGVGREMVKRFERWNVAVTAELIQILKDIQQ
ncbi:MAG: hypothetical protein ACOVS5_01935 [Oligoflexus sp.]|jgi:hypothetical protein